MQSSQGGAWELYAGTVQDSSTTAEVDKWVRVVGKLGVANDGLLSVERATRLSAANTGTNNLDGVTLGGTYLGTNFGNFDLARLTMWEDGTTVLEAERWLEENYYFDPVPPGNPVHWWDPNDYALSADQAIPGLIAHWSFDDADTSGSTLTDVLGTGLDATLVASPTTGVAGQRNEAYTFNGTTQYLDVGNQAALDFDVTDTFSVSCWFKMPTGGNYATLVSKYRYNTASGWQTFVNPDGSLGFSLSNAPFSAARYVYTQTLTHRDDTWRHAVFTYDGSNTVAGLKIYVNGVSVAVTTGADGDPIATLNSNSVFIGARDDASPSSFVDGEMDETAIFDRELSAAEVGILYANLGYPSAPGAGNVATLNDKGSGGENLVCTDLEIAYDADCPEQKVFKFNGTTSKAIDDGAFNLASNDILISACVRPETAGVSRALFAQSEHGASTFSCYLSTDNIIRRHLGINIYGEDLDTLAPFNTSTRWLNVSFHMAAAAGSGACYVDGSISGVGDEGDQTPDGLCVGGSYSGSYSSFLEGRMSDVIIYAGASEANAARAAEVEQWLQRHRRLSTLPVAPFDDVDAETLSLGDGDLIDTWANNGSESSFVAVGSDRPTFKAADGPEPQVGHRLSKRVLVLSGDKMDSLSAYTAKTQPGVVAVVWRNEEAASGAELTYLYGSDTDATNWGARLKVPASGLYRSQSDAGTLLITSTNLTDNVWHWTVYEFSNTTGEIRDSMGGTASGTVGAESQGTKSRLFASPADTNPFVGSAARVIAAQGSSVEALAEYMARRYPGVDPY